MLVSPCYLHTFEMCIPAAKHDIALRTIAAAAAVVHDLRTCFEVFFVFEASPPFGIHPVQRRR